jgi:hypothetical protein
MPMTKREIVGPQERFERSGAQRLRDIRPITTRLWSGMMSEFSGLILAVGAMAMFVEPALVNLVALGSLLYAGLVMSRRVTLPLRLPQTAGIRDWNYPSPVGRRPRIAAGSIYLGHDLKGCELTISKDVNCGSPRGTAVSMRLCRAPPARGRRPPCCRSWRTRSRGRQASCWSTARPTTSSTARFWRSLAGSVGRTMFSASILWWRPA